jgi:septation ring formation regulator EzrA
MVVSEINLYNALKVSLSESQAQTIVENLKEQIKNEVDSRKDLLATKEDISKLREDMARQETRLSQTIYIVGVVQFLAIIGSILMILKFTHT